MSKKSKIKSWISAARLRTLPLSISGILMGCSCALFSINLNKERATIFTEMDFSISNQFWFITLLGIITTLGFQVLSNFANDYGDGVKGTDNEDRIGPERAIQSGAITAKQMKIAIILTANISLISAIALIAMSLSFDEVLIASVFLFLAIVAIWAAIKYTVGDNAYGYKGLGDVFVFIFFGPVSVMGMYYLITKEVYMMNIIPSTLIGLLSVAVLNLNNMRDVISDTKVGKNTLVVKIGFERAKKLHLFIVVIALLMLVCHLLLQFTQLSYFDEITSYLILIPLFGVIPLIKHIIRVHNTEEPISLDPELKKVALSTFLISVLSFTSQILVF